MTKPQKLTKTFIDALLPAARDLIVWDGELKGFGVKVTPKGRKVFLVQHRPKGHTGAPKKYTIGKFGEWTVQQARHRALDVLHESAQGIDRGARERALTARRAVDQVKDLVNQFIERHAKQNRSVGETERIFQHDVLPAIGSKSIHDVTRHDVIKIVERVADRGAGTMANRVLAAIRKFMNWCVSRGVIDNSPAAGVASPTKERPRGRVLETNEIADIMRAADQIGYPFGTIVQLLFLTAQRRDEVGEMRWSEIDLDQGVWEIPAERSKNARAHEVHLSEFALALLNSLPRICLPDGTVSDLVFTTTGTTPFSGYSKAKKQLDKTSNTSCWRLHDIRRTVVTEMSKMGVPVQVADAILNHKSGAISGVTAVYQKNQFLEERRGAILQWSTHLIALAAISASHPRVRS